MTVKKRVEYIDLAKGLCITLVVLEHVARPLINSQSYMSDFLNACGTFRMPLYFILSGIFYKHYPFKIFLVKKANNLLVPYFFMFIVSNLCDVTLLYYNTGKLSLVGGDYPKISSATWFLLCLFELNMLLWLLDSFMVRSMFKPIVCLLLGLYGSMCKFPYFLDVCLTSIPFFYFGTLLKPFILGEKKLFCFDRCWYIVLLSILFIYYLYYPEGNVVSSNTFHTNMFVFYLYGILGTIFILLLSRKLNYLPFFSYIGRYSIIVLCWHFALLYPLRFLLEDTLTSSLLVIALLMLLIMLGMYVVVIPFCRKFLPYFFAQKNLIKLPE